MSANYLSFEKFTAEAKAAPLRAVGANGITVDGVRFNDRKLKWHAGSTVRCFVEESAIGPRLLCFYEEGRYLCAASPKRPYVDVFAVFGRALDFCPRALRKLIHFEPWHGQPWHIHLAAVQMSVMDEPPQLALPPRRSHTSTRSNRRGRSLVTL